MNHLSGKRVAPLVALLVIIFGIFGTLFFVSQDGSTPIPSPDNTDSVQAIAEVSTASATATVARATPLPPTPFDTETEYRYHRSQDELMVALYHIEAEAERSGWTAEAHIRAGNLWRDIGNPDRALPHWEAANTTEPSANLLRQIATTYINRSEWHIAWQRIQSLLELAPNDTWALYHGGMILAPYDPVTAYGYLGQVSGAGDEVQTAQQMLTVIADQTTSSDVILRIGGLLASAEEWSLAENAYQYAADFYYPFPEATAYVGLMRILQGKNGDASISEALFLNPNSALVNYVTGVYWRSAGEYAQSERALLTAIVLQPGNPTFFAELGNTYRAMGNPLEAETWLQTAVLISDNDPVIVNALNDFYIDSSTLPQVQTLVQIEDGEPADLSDASVISANGWAVHLSGDSEAGLAQIEEALALEPDNPRAQFDKARILIALDRTEEAIPVLTNLAEGDSVLAPAAQQVLDEQETDG
ncbi:MAG: tetratricopeptide repeat protein [Chloroflexota bacterium]